jgi:hypothetical protein
VVDCCSWTLFVLGFLLSCCASIPFYDIVVILLVVFCWFFDWIFVRGRCRCWVIVLVARFRCVVNVTLCMLMALSAVVRVVFMRVLFVFLIVIVDVNGVSRSLICRFFNVRCLVYKVDDDGRGIFVGDGDSRAPLKKGVLFSKTGCLCASAIASTAPMTPSGMGSSSHCCRDSLLPVVRDIKKYPLCVACWC